MAGKRISAEAPKSKNNETYHLLLPPNFFFRMPVIVPGAPGRVKLIAEFLNNVTLIPSDKRGLLSCKGTYKGVWIGGAATGMGVSSVFINVPEVREVGASIIIRQGSCGSNIPNSKPGDIIVAERAYCLDGASLMPAPVRKREAGLIALGNRDWFNEALITSADPRLVKLFYNKAQEIAPEKSWKADEFTTADFLNEQGRPDSDEIIPSYLKRRHEKIATEYPNSCYSMEAAGLYNLLGGKDVLAVNAVYAQRFSGEFEAGAGDELATKVLLEALVQMAEQQN